MNKKKKTYLNGRDGLLSLKKILLNVLGNKGQQGYSLIE